MKRVCPGLGLAHTQRGYTPGAMCGFSDFKTMRFKFIRLRVSSFPSQMTQLPSQGRGEWGKGLEPEKSSRAQRKEVIARKSPDLADPGQVRWRKSQYSEVWGSLGTSSDSSSFPRRQLWVGCCLSQLIGSGPTKPRLEAQIPLLLQEAL